MNDSSLLSLSNHFADAVDAAAPSVVQVLGHRRPASGVVFAPHLVVTTTRALGRENGVRVQSSAGSHDAELAGWDPATSLVVLRVEGLDAPAMATSTDPARVGQLALAVARSWSNTVTATAGIVSVIGGPLRTGRGRSIERVIRTSAPMHGGFAGGAFLDVGGRLVGITTAVDIRGLSVVIPADIAIASARSLAEHGTLKRGYLGIAGQTVRLTERQSPAEGRTDAVLVVGVAEGSPAEAAGVLVGDLILALDDAPVRSPIDVLEALQAAQVGREVRLQVLRGGAAQDVTAVIGEQPIR
jgi:S1-C subfamily serine protease